MQEYGTKVENGTGTLKMEEDNLKGESSHGTVFKQYLAAALATLMAVAMGTHLAWSSSAVLMLKAPSSQMPITTTEESWIGSLITLGACAGAIPAGFICTQLGPKRTLQLISLPLLLSWYIIGFSVSVWTLYLARIIAGLGAGAACVAAPLYVADIAHTKIRGTLGTFFQLQITNGLLLGYVLGGIVENFQLLALLSSIVPIIFMATFSFMPESPVFLQSKGRTEDARKSFEFFRGPDYDLNDELRRIDDNLHTAKGDESKKSLLELLLARATMKGLLISLALMFFQQMSGINAVLFYAGPIFKDTGTKMSASLCTIIVGIVQVLATFVSTFLIDRLGRKILLFASAFVMSACIGNLSIYFYFESQNCDMSKFYSIPLICVAVFIIAFSIGYGPIPWMMMSELLPANVKGIASSISAAFNWILAFIVTFSFQSAKESFGPSVTFGFFAVISAVAAAFSLLLVPETKGRTLEEIQALLQGRPTSSEMRNSKNPQFVE